MNPDLTPAPIPVPESDPFLPLDPPGSTVDLSRWKQIPLGLMNEYRVQFDVFEGPLDLLLHLVKKQEVDIYQVNLTRIASEFVAYIDQMRELDLEIAGEFLVMAATLIYIKSRELLPADQKPEAQIGEEDEEDPRFELIRRLVEYKKFKDAAAELQSLETRMVQVYEHRSAQVVLPEIEPQRREPVSIFELIQAVSVILKRFGERDDVREIQADPLHRLGENGGTPDADPREGSFSLQRPLCRGAQPQRSGGHLSGDAGAHSTPPPASDPERRLRRDRSGASTPGGPGNRSN